MQPITYGKKGVFDFRDNFVLFSLFFTLTATMNITLPPIWESPDGWDLIHRGGRILPWCGLAIVFFVLSLPKYNSLQADEDELTYSLYGQRNAWPWQDISTFTIAEGWRGPRIEFTVSKDDGRWRTAPLRRTKAGLTGTIPNIWDAPLEEIASTLNAYRERALGGDAPASEPSTAG